MWLSLVLLGAMLSVAYVWFVSGTTAPELDSSERLPGGEGSVSIKPFASFMLPPTNMAEADRPNFHAGKALARQPWIKAPTITDARDGLGPIYNARTCLACHLNGGRGVVPEQPDRMLVSGIVRLSIPGKNEHGEALPEPVYGGQFQSQSVALLHQLRGSAGIETTHDPKIVRPEGYVYIRWHEQNYTYPDGKTLRLQYPEIQIRNLGYGELHENVMTSLRNAPPIHGMGLLQGIAQSDIDALADPDDADANGISGRVNIVWDFSSKRAVPGRFGWKANSANIRDQVAGAFRGDVGIVNSVFPEQPCTSAQPACVHSPHGTDENGLELADPLLKLAVDFTRSLAVPKRRKPEHELVMAGRENFYSVGCAECHQPSFTTMANADFPHLSEQKIWPYTDLLLHDMGQALADNRPDFDASGSEWRTPPLWGVGLSKAVNGNNQLLHDGRARNVEEAIIWHGGEAQASRDKFAALSQANRKALIAFVRSL